MKTEIFICGLCGQEVRMSQHIDKDWCCISCQNPNCLKPSTGWSLEKALNTPKRKYK